MPRTYKPKTDRKNGSHLLKEPPQKFKAGFLASLDGRTDLAKFLRTNHDQIVADVGGPDQVGKIKATLIEKFCWLDVVLQTLENEMAHGQIDKSQALGSWIQGVNSLSGLARVLGVERRARSMPWLNLPALEPEAKPAPPAPEPATQGAPA